MNIRHQHPNYDCGGEGHGPNASEVQWCHDCVPHLVIELDEGEALDAEKVWRALEATPGFNESLREADADIAAGKGVPFREVRG